MSGNPGGGKGLPTGAGLPVSAPNQNRVLPTPAAALPNPMSTIAGAQQPTPASDLASLFECPVCFDYVLPPILQCHAGHLVCSNCRPKLTCCPTCRGQLGGNIRNLAMEKVASTVMFPCKYSSGGCGAQLLHTDKVSVKSQDTCNNSPSYQARTWGDLWVPPLLLSLPWCQLQVAGLTRAGHGSPDADSQVNNNTPGRRYCISSNRHQSSRYLWFRVRKKNNLQSGSVYAQLPWLSIKYSTSL